MSKYRRGDRFELKGHPVARYEDWSTVVIVGNHYNYTLSEIFYPVHVNGRKYEVITERALDVNFKKHVEFTPGFYEYVLHALPTQRGEIRFFNQDPSRLGSSEGHWERRVVIDWQGAKHE